MRRVPTAYASAEIKPVAGRADLDTDPDPERVGSDAQSADGVRNFGLDRRAMECPVVDRRHGPGTQHVGGVGGLLGHHHCFLVPRWL